MANQQHLDLLRQDISSWNTWRDKHPDILLDLSGADLSFAKLSFAKLSNANLSGASLSFADLSFAKLSNVNLSGASLSFAILSNAILSRADLSYGDLSGADLSRADLSRSNLSGSDLSGSDLSRVSFGYTTFAWVDLRSVKGLETAIHGGPSTVNINSVTFPTDEHTYKHFLLGVGFTETQIEYLPSLLTPRPIQYHSLFISYASQDEIIANQLHSHFRKNDVPCWFAPHDLRPGTYFRERIDQAIHTQDKVLLLLSEHSVNSGWVRYEVELTLSREIRQQREILFPIRLDDAIFHATASWAASLQATRHIGNFTDWQDNASYQQAFTLLLGHLKVTKSPTM